MAKYHLIADVRAYVTVEAENEDEAHVEGKNLPISAWLFEEQVDDIWCIEED